MLMTLSCARLPAMRASARKRALASASCAAGFGQDLHRHGAADDRIAGAVDVRHAAAQELFQLVLADARGQLHHGLATSATQPKPEK